MPLILSHISSISSSSEWLRASNRFLNYILYSCLSCAFSNFFFLFFIGVVGVETGWVHLALRPPIGLLCQPRVIMMMEKLVE
jgi:hypothetical protein